MTSLQSVTHTPEHVELEWDDGVQSWFPAIWMRDNVPSARHRPDGQKLFDIRALPADVSIRAAVITATGQLRVSFGPECLDAEFDPAWLTRYRQRARDERRTPWDARLAVFPEDSWHNVSTERSALGRWLRSVVDYGFALLRGVPTEPGRVLEVASLFGHVRETNYGRLFDVITEPSPANLANAGVGLGLHTDNPYRDPVPTLQLLHCLSASDSGGESVLCDGLRVAEALRDAHPQDFALLCHNPVLFRYVDDAVDLDFRAPMIETNAAGTVHALRYNHRSLAPLDLDMEIVADYYRAYRRFGAMLHDPCATISFRLAPGDMFIVDNRRVLHGRGAFSPGQRHLQGCYADMDGLRSTLRHIEGAAA